MLFQIPSVLFEIAYLYANLYHLTTNDRSLIVGRGMLNIKTNGI